MFILSSVIGCGNSNSKDSDTVKKVTSNEPANIIEPTKEAATMTPAITATPAPATSAPTTTPLTTTTPATPKPSVKPANIKLGSSWKMIYSKDYPNAFYSAGFNDKKNGLTVGYGGVIYYTVDGGKNWESAVNSSACRFGLDYASDKVLYTCGNQGHITKSTNSGVDFASATSFGDSEPNQCRSLSFCDENNGIIASRKRMAITKDGAKSWTELTIPSELIALYMVSPDTFYYIDSTFNLYKTVDGGFTWESTPMNLPLGTDYFELSNSFSLFVDADNAFTVFCTQRSTRELKSYSTIDNWGTLKENKVPDINGVLTFYVNHKGNVVTICDLNEKKIHVVTKK